MRATRPRGRRGASAIEFALTLPLVIAVASAVLDYGWYLTLSANVLHAVREGCRYGASVEQDDDPSSEAIAQTEAALSALGIDCGGATSGCTVDATMGSVDDLRSITVRAEITYNPLLGVVPTPAVLQGALTMALEDQSEGS